MELHALIQQLGGQYTDPLTNDDATRMAIVLMFEEISEEILNKLTFASIASLRYIAPDNHHVKTWAWAQMLKIGTFQDWHWFMMRTPEKETKLLALQQMKESGIFSDWEKILNNWHNTQWGRYEIPMTLPELMKNLYESVSTFEEAWELNKISFSATQRCFRPWYYCFFLSKKPWIPNRKEVQKKATDVMSEKGTFTDWLGVFEDEDLRRNEISYTWLEEQLILHADGKDLEQWNKIYRVVRTPSVKQQVFEKMTALV